MDLVQREFGDLRPARTLEDHTAPSTQAPIHLETKRDLEQVHLCIGVPSLPLGHEARFAAAVLNNLLGGGMSSRLFQNIREKEGLAYAVFSELTPYSDAGMFTVYAGTAKETVGQVIDLTIKEFRAMKESPVSEEELTRAKNHLKGSLMLSLESTTSRMSNLARQELYFGRFYSLDEILASIETVTLAEVQCPGPRFLPPRTNRRDGARPPERLHPRPFPPVTASKRGADSELIPRRVFALTGGNRNAIILKIRLCEYFVVQLRAKRSACGFPFWRQAARATLHCSRRSAPDSSWTAASANAKL